MEFQAQIAGAEMKSKKESTTNTQKQADTNGKETLADRLRKRKQEQQEQQGKTGKATFMDGVGYQTIGG